MLADRPARFENGGEVIRAPHDLAFPFSLTNRGMELRCTPSFVVKPHWGGEPIDVIILNCKRTGTMNEQDPLDRVAILLQRDRSLKGDQYLHVSHLDKLELPRDWRRQARNVDQAVSQEKTYIVPEDTDEYDSFAQKMTSR